MRCLKVLTVFKALAVFLVLGGSLTLTACLGNGATSTRDIQACFSQLSTSQVHPVGNTISFTITTAHGASTYSVPKSAFGGAPATMKNGDLISFCAETVDVGGHSATTITQFSNQGRPAGTGTPQSH